MISAGRASSAETFDPGICMSGGIRGRRPGSGDDEEDSEAKVRRRESLSMFLLALRLYLLGHSALTLGSKSDDGTLVFASAGLS